MANKNEIKFEQPSDLLIIINRYVVVIMFLLIFAILMSGYYFLLKPKMASNEARQEVNAKNISNQQASERLLDSLAKLEVEYKDIQATRQADLEKLKKILPTNPQIAELFVMANHLAMNNGLKLNSVDIAEAATVAPKKNNKVTDEESFEKINFEATNDSADFKNKKPAILNTMSLHFSLTRISEKELKDIFPDEIYPFDSKMDDYTLFKKYIAVLEANMRLMDIQSLTIPSFSAEAEHSLPSFNFSVLTYYR